MIWLAYAGAAETMPSHGPHGKSFNLLQFSPCVRQGFPYKKGICELCRSPPSNMPWTVRRALNAISDRNKTET